MSAPISSYHEKLSGHVDCHYELFPDRIRQSGKGLHGRFDISHQLSHLVSVPDRWWLRNKNHFWLLVSLIFFEVTLIGFALADPELVLLYVPIIVVGLIGGLVLMSMPTRIEYCFFKSCKTGESQLAIGRSGPDVEQYERFIDLVCRQIELAERMIS